VEALGEEGLADNIDENKIKIEADRAKQRISPFEESSIDLGKERKRKVKT